jgi:hypothetical protein
MRSASSIHRGGPREPSTVAPDAVRSWTPRCRTCASTTGGSATNPGLACSWPLGCWRARPAVARRRARPADQGRPGRAPRRPTINGLPWPRWPTPPRSTAGRCRRSGPRPRHDHARVPKRHGCDGRRTRARHGRGGVPSGDSDTGPAQARRPWRTGAARRVGFQSWPERVTSGHRLRVLGTRTLTEYGGQHPRRGGKGQRCPSSQPTLRRRTMRPTRKPTTITMAT